jgi:hypothetical protein
MRPAILVKLSKQQVAATKQQQQVAATKQQQQVALVAVVVVLPLEDLQ